MTMRSVSKWVSLLCFSFLSVAIWAQTPETSDPSGNDAIPDFTGNSYSKDKKPAKKPAATTAPTTAPATQPTNINPSSTTSSQIPGTPTVSIPVSTTVTPGNSIKIEAAENTSAAPPDKDAPIDGIVEKRTILDKEVLPWEPVRESDIMWSKRIWRVIDIREKINLAFTNQEVGQSFLEILLKGVQDTVSGIKAYKADNDKFQYRLSAQEASTIGSHVDTIDVIDPVTFEPKHKITNTKLDPREVKRFRVKEDWFFDKQYSVLKVRILGISPLKDETDAQGNFLYEQPLFWVYYPDCREFLSKQRAMVEGNDANPMSWEDLFEQRRFSSYIFKESNAYNRRLQSYLQGVDILLEGEKIKKDIFNFEHDLWSY